MPDYHPCPIPLTTNYTIHYHYNYNDNDGILPFSSWARDTMVSMIWH